MKVTGLLTNEYNVSITLPLDEIEKVGKIKFFCELDFHNAHRYTEYKGNAVFNIRCTDMMDGAKIETMINML